ncbi:hypothetical protein [Citricoccus muralis]|uniref:Small integral membrane protein DUF2273 n=1 Tax=Citricoccus muralis TaxID=169134 RepID=A0ABY8H768_9MICC|nr:hypothetical protein [Citricoccus muralis]WFP16498.1 hypothetical protein P8192_14140 [Citricoccus muralis]
MSRTSLGLIVGLVLGIVAYFGGFMAFLVVSFFAAVGLVVGLVLDGRLDLGALVGRATDRR